MRGIALGLSAGIVVSGVGFSLFNTGAQETVSPPAGPARVAFNTGAGGSDAWLTYKGDLQRTGMSNARLQFPLNLVWRHSTDNGPKRVTMSPLVLGPAGQRRIYYAAGKAVYCLDGETGAELWHSKPLAGMISAPITLLNGDAGDHILAITANGQLTALQAANGDITWQASSRAQVPNVAPVVINTPKGERIIVGVSSGRLIAFTREGAIDPEWDVKLGRTGSQPSSTPALSPNGQNLFLTTSDKKVYVIDVTRPAIAYTIPFKAITATSPVMAGKQVILSAGSLIGSHDQTNAMASWQLNLGQNADIDASPAVRMGPDGNGTVYVGARNGYFHAIDARLGKLLWKVNLQSSVTGSPIALQDTILVGTRPGLKGGGGELFALAADDGKILWRYRLQSDSVTVDEGGDEGPIEGGTGGPFGGGYPGGSSSSSSGYPGSSSGGYPGSSGRRGGPRGGGYPGGAAGGYPGGSSSSSSGGYPGSGRRGGGYPGGAAGGYPGGGYPGGAAGGYPGGGYPGGDGMMTNGSTARRFTLNYGISAPPAVVDGQVFVLADHGVLYNFDSTPFDPEPPRTVTPSITLKTQENETRPFLLEPGKFPPIPGRAPLYFAAEIADSGSGVDPSSLQVTFDGQPLPPTSVNYVAPQGILRLTLLAVPPRGAPSSLKDGTHTIGIVARDYRGNTLNYNGSFVVDKNASPPSYVPPEPEGGYGNPDGGYPGSSSGGYPGGSSSSSSRRRGGRRGGGDAAGGYPGGGSSSSGSSGSSRRGGRRGGSGSN